MKNLLKITLALLAFANPAAAYDAVYASRVLSDNEFYSLAACNATAGGNCRAPLVRWSSSAARGLGIAIKVSRGAAGNGQAIAAIEAATARAINEINGAGAGIQLALVSKSRAKIVLEIVTPSEMARYVGRSGSSSRGDAGADGYSTIWWNDSNKIRKGEIKISIATPGGAINSVVLEEIFQALGFPTDVAGAPYDSVSILSEGSNAVTRIKGQDRMLLLRHYPR